MQAARFLRVPPWELERQPLKWRDRAIALMDAYAHAADMAARRKEPWSPPEGW